MEIKYGIILLQNLFQIKLFGSFAPTHKKFSFSASFGVDYLPEEESKAYQIYQTYLKELKAVSVRETAGRNMIKKVANREDVEVLIDPTMLLEVAEWERVMKKPEDLKDNRFIIKSFLGKTSDKIEKELERIAKENNCQIIDISSQDSEFYNMGPAEFLYLEKNAFLVATDSFHSCVFSILFSTPFVVFEREDKFASMYSRIETLLEKFEMKESIFKEKINEEIFKMDLSKIEKVLEVERKKANSFLEKALQ